MQNKQTNTRESQESALVPKRDEHNAKNWKKARAHRISQGSIEYAQ